MFSLWLSLPPSFLAQFLLNSPKNNIDRSLQVAHRPRSLRLGRVLRSRRAGHPAVVQQLPEKPPPLQAGGRRGGGGGAATAAVGAPPVRLAGAHGAAPVRGGVPRDARGCHALLQGQ